MGTTSTGPKRRNKLMLTIVLSRRAVGPPRGLRAARFSEKIEKAGPISWGQFLEQFSKSVLGIGSKIWHHFFAFFRHRGAPRAARTRAAKGGRGKYYRVHYFVPLFWPHSVAPCFYGAAPCRRAHFPWLKIWGARPRAPLIFSSPCDFSLAEYDGFSDAKK